MIVSGIGEEAFDEGEEGARGVEQRPAAVAVLDARRVRLDQQTTAIDVDERMAPVDLLARVVAARPAGLGRLDALAVDDRRRWAGLAPGALAIGHDQGMVDRLEDAVVAPCREPPINRAPRRKVARQKAPGNAAAQHVEDRIDDLAQRPGAGPSRGLRRRKVVPSAAIRRRSDRSGSESLGVYSVHGWSGSTCESPSWRQPLGITGLSTTQPLSKRPPRTSWKCFLY